MYQYYNYNPYQPQTQYVPQQYIQQQSFDSPDVLNGKIVDSVEVVKAINADLSGKPNYYPKSDGSEIYCKRINPQTGASGIQTYVLKTDPSAETESEFSILKKELMAELNEIKDLISPKNQNKGGAK